MAEHRCQIVFDRQTHTVPNDPRAQEQFARMMGRASWEALSAEFGRRRRRVRATYHRFIVEDRGALRPRELVLDALGPHAELGANWLDELPEAGAFYASLCENRDSLRRVRRLLERAPGLVPHLARSVSVTEAVLSGEIFERRCEGSSLTVAANAALKALAEELRRVWTTLVARNALHEHTRFRRGLAQLFDAALGHVTSRLYAEFDVVALGSYASGDLSLASDLDVILLVADPARHQDAESQAEQMLNMIDALKRFGAPLSVDLRLRPEGSKGLLVRSYEGLRSYDVHGMEPWERFALGASRFVRGSRRALEPVRRAALALPLTPERLEMLMHLKHRMETERVSLRYRMRHVKLGQGGLSDIEWFLRLHEMRYPSAARACAHPGTLVRLRALAKAGLINAVELEALIRARSHLLRVRDSLVLLGFTTDIVPENPDRLARLAEATGYPEGNAFLAAHERITQGVRAIYEEGVERLRA
jgi:glutamate-ammonia-ligase adenylyltransferase